MWCSVCVRILSSLCEWFSFLFFITRLAAFFVKVVLTYIWIDISRSLMRSIYKYILLLLYILHIAYANRISKKKINAYDNNIIQRTETFYTAFAAGNRSLYLKRGANVYWIRFRSTELGYIQTASNNNNNNIVWWNEMNVTKSIYLYTAVRSHSTVRRISHWKICFRFHF